MEKTVFIKVYGKVQNVGFRWCSYEQFVDLGLKGTSENAKDGTVEILVTGEVENLKQFLRWAHQGPEGSRVSKVEYKTIDKPDEPKKDQPTED